MKFAVLALDFDGTIAEHGRVSREVRGALAEVRERGIAVVLATGRILEDLRDVAGDLSFADAIVAENGAVMALHATPPRALCRAPAAAFARALTRAGISFRSGRCVVEADAPDAAAMLSIVRSLELPLVLTFNRGRVMALPPGVCKSAGLREALRALRLSPRNALAIGDAENDHDLLEACEYGAAVEWGSRALQEAADGVVPGASPPDVAAYLRRAIASMRLPEARAARRTVVLGRGRDGREVRVEVRGRNLLVAGDPRSGKSWAAGLLSEQLVLLGYSLCVVDPEGDYWRTRSASWRSAIGAGRSWISSPRWSSRSRCGTRSRPTSRRSAGDRLVAETAAACPRHGRPRGAVTLPPRAIRCWRRCE